MGKFGRDQGASPQPAGTIGQPAATGPHPAAKPVFFSSIKRCDGNWSLDHPSSKGAPRRPRRLRLQCSAHNSTAARPPVNATTSRTQPVRALRMMCSAHNCRLFACIACVPAAQSARPAHVAHAPLRPPPRSVVSSPPHAAQRRRAAQPPSVPPRGMHPRPSAHPWPRVLPCLPFCIGTHSRCAQG